MGRNFNRSSFGLRDWNWNLGGLISLRHFGITLPDCEWLSDISGVCTIPIVLSDYDGILKKYIKFLPKDSQITCFGA